MKRELLAFVKSQGYGICIGWCFQKLLKVTRNPIANKRLVWEYNCALKGGCPFSFNAVELSIGY
jgi:hypothetical protein